MEPLAPHEKIFIDEDILEEDDHHSELTCVDCHGGNPEDSNWETAHKGVVRDPTYPKPQVCMDCHDQSPEQYGNSLHYTTQPMIDAIMARTTNDPKIRDKVEAAARNNCGKCHASCGQCHVSRPDSAGGGFLNSHKFVKTPPMQQVCTACHGSRVGNEYLGENKSCQADIHHEKARMTCEKCHKADEMHGDGIAYKNRYEVKNRPRCIDCHEKIFGPESQNRETHKIHRSKVSCQVCHSQAYTSCVSCHIGKTKDGRKYYEVKDHELGFKIGLSPLKSKDRPETFVTVRHAPVDHKSFHFYAKDALKNFDVAPTWKLTTPHNIRRQTPQNKTCDACHGNPDLFLLEKDVRPEYLKANKSVIVPKNLIPKKIK